MLCADPPATNTITAGLQASASSRERQLAINHSAVFHELVQGHSMLSYERTPTFLRFINTPDVQRDLWSARSGWRIAEALDRVYCDAVAERVRQSRTLSITCDESTTDAGESRMSVHVNYVQAYERHTVLAGLPVIEGAPDAATLTALLLLTLTTFLGLSCVELAARIVMMAADGASVLQGGLSGVIRRIRQQAGPFLLAMHCVAHRADLAAATIANCILMQQLIALLSAAYNLFKKSGPQRSLLKQCQLEAQLRPRMRGVMPKRDVQTRWVSHAKPAFVMWESLPALLLWAHKHEDSSTLAVIELISMLTDLTLLLILAVFLPMLHQLSALILVLQRSDLYVQVCLCRSHWHWVASLELCSVDCVYCCKDEPWCVSDLIRHTDHSHALASVLGGCMCLQPACLSTCMMTR